MSFHIGQRHRSFFLDYKDFEEFPLATDFFVSGSLQESHCRINKMNLLPFSEAENRVRKMQQWMQKSSIDAVFIFQNTDLYFFSGTTQSGLLCLPCVGDPIYLVTKSAVRANWESAWKSIVALPKLEKAPEILESEGIGGLRKVGLEMDVIPANNYFRITRSFPDVEFLDASPVIREIRMIKSPYEVNQIREAAKMILQAWQQLPSWIRPGATELEVLAQMEQYLRLQGHQGMLRTRGFNYEIGYGAFSAGANACFPTSFPGSTGFKGLYPAVSNAGSEHRLAPGEPLIVDIAGAHGGYIADATRTFAVGSLPSDLQKAHTWILELNYEIESMLVPGTQCRKISDHAFAKADDSPFADTFMGFGDNHLRFIGHGVGLELDELPVLAPKSSHQLKAGMVLAIEPKVFFPDRGGVGIENMYLITETGFEKLTPYREDIIICSEKTVASGQSPVR
jgi:Xaa-Pro dipeptidase